MRVLILGGGGREHALAWKLAQNATVDKLFASPGNAGIASLAECVTLDANDPSVVADFVESKRIDLTVIGPEAPLVAGVADELAARGMRAFGPTRAGARIESSKAWAKELMRAAGVPTASWGTFERSADAMAFVEGIAAPYVVKADGLAAGKGVMICETENEAEKAVRAIVDDRVFGAAGERVVIEEYLEGVELSAFAITDGHDVVQLTEARDFKRAYDADDGPNTGGMGAFSPVPDDGDVARGLADLVFAPVVRRLEREGIRYVGVLYAGLMLTADGPRVLEFNARFGDPEAQVIIPRLAGDLGEMMLACSEGNVEHYVPRWRPESCVGVVVASANYPDTSPTGFPIRGLADAEAMSDVVVFHAGTRLQDGAPVTSGGRVLTVSALGATLAGARARAYDAASRITFEGARMRRDIAEAAARRG
jgi:phosphoribosylamine--glycine ligase